MIEVKLEPCPFCGETREENGESTFGLSLGRTRVWWVSCLTCGGVDGPVAKTRKGAVVAWNTRAPHPSHAAVEAMAQALEKAEWAEWPDPYCGMQLFCAECRNFKKRGHSKDCAIGTALAAYRATQNKDVRP